MPKDGRTFRHASLYLSVALAIGFVSYQSSGSVLIAVAVGMLSGLGVTYVLLRLDRQANRRLSALDLPDGEYSPRIHATAFVKGSPEEVFIACERAIQRLPNFGKVTLRLDGAHWREDSLVHAVVGRTDRCSDRLGSPWHDPAGKQCSNPPDRDGGHADELSECGSAHARSISFVPGPRCSAERALPPGTRGEVDRLLKFESGRLQSASSGRSLPPA